MANNRKRASTQITAYVRDDLYAFARAFSRKRGVNEESDTAIINAALTQLRIYEEVPDDLELSPDAENVVLPKQDFQLLLLSAMVAPNAAYMLYGWCRKWEQTLMSQRAKAKADPAQKFTMNHEKTLDNARQSKASAKKMHSLFREAFSLARPELQKLIEVTVGDEWDTFIGDPAERYP
jgi:hypothetical protein